MSFDFDAAVTAPFRMQPGLRRLAADDPALTPARPGSRHLREKLAVLGAFPAQALLAVDGFDPQPALDALIDHAAAAHPDALARDGRGVAAPRLGWAVAAERAERIADDADAGVGRVLDALPPPWRLPALVALAFEEDLAIVDGERATLPWLAVCLPSHWAPEAKLGRHFAEVHAPVPEADALRAAGASLLRVVSSGERFERFVWTVTAHTRLHAHPARAPREPWPADATPDELAATLRFRAERQSFLPLPRHRQAVFAIHVTLEPLADAVAAPGRAARLAGVLASMSDAVLAYRGLDGARDRLVDWLRTRP